MSEPTLPPLPDLPAQVAQASIQLGINPGIKYAPKYAANTMSEPTDKTLLAMNAEHFGNPIPAAVLRRVYATAIAAHKAEPYPDQRIVLEAAFAAGKRAEPGDERARFEALQEALAALDLLLDGVEFRGLPRNSGWYVARRAAKKARAALAPAAAGGETP